MESVNFVINIIGNAKKAVEDIENSVVQLNGSIEKTAGFWKRIGTYSLDFTSTVNAVKSVASGFGMLTGSALDFEQQQANLRTLLDGDSAAVERLVKNILEYGKATVYDRSGLVEAQKTGKSIGELKDEMSKGAILSPTPKPSVFCY